MSRPFELVTVGSHRAPASLGAAAAVGVLATVTMDAAMLGAAIVGGDEFRSKRLGAEMIGRWVARLLHGRLLSLDISREPSCRGELVVGLATHYATGIALSGAFVLVAGQTKPPLMAGVGYGVATSVLPLLVMFPSMGYGICGSRSGEAGRMTRIMLVGHVGFGAGIGIWSRRFAAR